MTHAPRIDHCKIRNFILSLLFACAGSADSNAWSALGGSGAHTQRGGALGPSDTTTVTKWASMLSNTPSNTTILSGSPGGQELVFATSATSVYAFYGDTGVLAWGPSNVNGTVIGSCLAPSPTSGDPDILAVLSLFSGGAAFMAFF